MNEQDYFEQFTGDVDEPYFVSYDTSNIPAFSHECPVCHGFGYTEIGDKLTIAQPCPRCWLLVGR